MRIALWVMVGTILIGPTGPARAAGPGENAAKVQDVRGHGAFGFPQARSQLVCSYANLRVSVWNNAEYLYVQAVLWRDNNDGMGPAVDKSKKTRDTSMIALDLDADGAASRDVDRDYHLSKHLLPLRLGGRSSR